MRSAFWGLCIVGLFVACSEKEETADLHLSDTEFTWDATVRQQTLTVATPTRWTIKSNVNWCAPWKSSGEKGAEVQLWVSPNLTSQSRSGTLTVSSGGSVKLVKVSQPAYTGNVDEYEYVLPVVFHVLYKDEADEKQNVRKGWLAELLAKVNNLYKSNGIGVTFEMATCNQEGEELEELGIMRHKVSFDSLDPNVFLSGSAEAMEYADYEQHLRRFINVYLFRFGSDAADDISQLGVSDMPLTTTAHPLDSLTAVPTIENYTHMSYSWGVCINSDYIYELSERGRYNPSDVSVTLAHELGHYLGLLHSFSLVECLYDDACSDTPVCDYTAYHESISQLLEDYRQRYGSGLTLTLDELARREDCNEAGRTYIADNIMDYAYCYSNTLTPQQRSRIRHVLNYCPLVPGPKLVDYGVGSSTRSVSSVQPVLSGCPSVPLTPVSVVP